MQNFTICVIGTVCSWVHFKICTHLLLSCKYDVESWLYVKIMFQGHTGTFGSRGAVGPPGPPVSQRISVVCSTAATVQRNISCEVCYCHPTVPVVLCYKYTDVKRLEMVEKAKLTSNDNISSAHTANSLCIQVASWCYGVVCDCVCVFVFSLLALRDHQAFLENWVQRER